MTHEEIAAELVGMMQRHAYRRLEISRHGGRFGGYCVDAEGDVWVTPRVLAVKRVTDGVVAARAGIAVSLLVLLHCSGHRRLEVCGPSRPPGGYCIDGAGVGWNFLMSSRGLEIDRWDTP